MVADSFHVHRLQKTYAKHLATLRGTGEGVGSVNEDGAVFNECLVPADGPDGATPEHAVNLWSECNSGTQIVFILVNHIVEKIHEAFPWFGALHRILSSRPNIVPPAIVTGVGPAGREIIYNTPPPPSQEHDPNIDPALYALGHNSPPGTPPPSQRRTSTRSRRSIQNWDPTPLFTQPGVSSQPPPPSRSATPASLPSSQRAATPSSPQSKFAAVMAKAKENVKTRPPKRQLEDLLSDGIS